jgi:hypothetical protein
MGCISRSAGATTIIGLVLWTAGPAGAAGPPPKPQAAKVSTEEVRKLVEQLGDDNPGTREKATRRLADLGPVVLPALREAAGSKDIEVRRRAQSVIEDITSKGLRRVEERMKELKAAGLAPVVPLTGEAIGRAVPRHLFYSVIFRQYPVARVVPEGLKAQNLFVVNPDGSVKQLTDTKELQALFRTSLQPVRDERGAKEAARAWLELAPVRSGTSGARKKPRGPGWSWHRCSSRTAFSSLRSRMAP